MLIFKEGYFGMCYIFELDSFVSLSGDEGLDDCESVVRNLLFSFDVEIVAAKVEKLGMKNVVV